MKANTPDLMKFKRLQRRLNVSVAQVAGHLELLWLATAKNAPEGDVGRFSNEDIAIACYWDGEPDLFVNALVECGWLDASAEWRLLVHDWAQHAPTYVHGALKRHGRNFRCPNSEPPKEAPKEAAKEAPIEDPIGTSPEDTPTKPSLTKPSQAKPSPSLTKPSQAVVDGSVVGGGGELGNFDLVAVDHDDCCRECLRLAEALVKKKIQVDSDSIWRWGWLATALGQHGLLSEVATKVRSGEVTKPKGYVEASLRRACTERGKDLVAVTRCVPQRPRPVNA